MKMFIPSGKISAVKKPLWIRSCCKAFIFLGLMVGMNAVQASEQKFEPIMPREFDQATVQHLLDKVDEYPNAILLKVGYFSTFSNPVYSTPQGFQLLNAQLEKESVGSRKWFFLESVRGWAGFRVQGKADEGMVAYRELLDHSGGVDNAGAREILERSLYELTLALETTPLTGAETAIRGVFKLADHNSAHELIIKSLQTQLSLASTSKELPLLLPWDEVLIDPKLKAEAQTVVDVALSRHKVHPTFGLLLLAAQIDQFDNPSKAVGLLEQGRGNLNSREPRAVARFYPLLVSSLVNANMLDAAVTEQKRYIALSGRGRAALLDLYTKRKDYKSIDEEISELTRVSANTDDTDMVDVAERLVRMADRGAEENLHWRSAAESILATYLGPMRQRLIEQELRARSMFAQLLEHEGKLVEAIKVLDVQYSPNSFPSDEARWRFEALQNTLKRLKVSN